MARIRGKKALYEVIGKSSFPKAPAAAPPPAPSPPPPPEETVADEPESPVEQPAAAAPAIWPRKPRILQINAGRIEFSVPYQIAIAVLLGLVLLFLVVFRLGQMSFSEAPADEERAVGSKETDNRSESPTPVALRSVPAPEPMTGVPATATATGSNAIVIVEYPTKRDLEPVQKHFGRYGIETEIVPGPRGHFFLRTKDRYDRTGEGSRCDTDRQKIVTIGAMYKAEPGYETFGAQPFNDAYPRKVD